MHETIYQRVLAGVFDQDSEAVAQTAAAEAAARGAVLFLYARHLAVVRDVCTTWPGLVVSARPAPRDMVSRLIHESRTSRLLVLPRDTAGQYENVVAHAQCPTMLVPDRPAAGADGPVVVCVDIAANDEPAIRFAFEEAALRGVPLVALHSWAGVPQSDLSPVDPYRYDLPATTGTVDRMLAEELAGWADRYPDVRVERRLWHEPDPARGLLAATADAGVVVLGAHHDPHSPHLIGTVARRVLRGINRPAIVVRLAARQRAVVAVGAN